MVACVQSGQPNTAIYQQGSCRNPAERARSFPYQSHEEISSCPEVGLGLALDVPAPGSAVSPSQGTQARHSCGDGDGTGMGVRGCWWAGHIPRGGQPPISAGLAGAAAAECDRDVPRPLAHPLQPWMTFIRQR